MKLIKTVKRVMAIGTGAAMMGATLSAGAFAADLSDYPSPFIKNGRFNGLIVVGDSAASADVLGSVDIATTLQYAARVKRTMSSDDEEETSSSVMVKGEHWDVSTSSNNFELSERGGGTGKTESFRDVTTSISKEELPTLLADGEVRNDQGNFDYEQFFKFDPVASPTGTDAKSRTVVHVEDEDDVVAPMFYIKSDDQILRYVLEFDESLESEITTSNGDRSASRTYLWSLEGEEIEILGKTWSILQARTGSGQSSDSVELTLMAGSALDNLDEGESKTYTVGGKDYDVRLDFISGSDNDRATFTVNGEATRSLRTGTTHELTDGALIGIRDITTQDIVGGIRRVSFYIGADKVVLQDDSVSASNEFTDELEIEDDTIDGAGVRIVGSKTSSTFKIDSIELNITANDDVYLDSGDKLSEQLDDDDAKALMGAWDILFEGLEDVSTETIKLDPKTDQYHLEFKDGNGDRVNFPLFYADNEKVDLKVDGGANEDEKVVISEGEQIREDDYFVISDTTADAGERETFVFQYMGSDRPDSSTHEATLEFKNLGSNERKEVDVDLTGTGNRHLGELTVSGTDYHIWTGSSQTMKSPYLRINLNADTSGDNEAPTTDSLIEITTYAGAEITFTANYTGNLYNDGADDFKVSITSPDDDKYDDLVPSAVDFKITATAGSDAEVEIERVGDRPLAIDGTGDKELVYTSLGAYVVMDNLDEDGSGKVTIEYPTKQRLPQLFLVASGASASKETSKASGEGGLVYYETQPINVGSAKLASEVSNVASQNVIAVGGPCANAVAAELMGKPANCAKDFEKGKALVKLIEHSNGNVGMVVAGYDAADTRRAARVVANYESWQTSGKFAGKEVEITGSTFSDISVKKMEAKAANGTST